MKHSTLNSVVASGTALVVAITLGASDAKAADDLEISHLKLFSAQFAGEVSVQEIGQYGVIPYRVDDSCYGWYLAFEPIDAAVRLEERLSIPGPALVWDTDAQSVVADDRKSAETVLEFDGRLGEAEHTWCVAEGDPEGLYSFVLSRNGQTLGQLSFRLERQ